MPTQNRSVRGGKITEWLKMKVSQITLRWAGLKVQNGSKNLAIVHGRVRDDVEKKMWMKNINKWRITTTKWRSTSQKPPEVLPSKYHRWEFLIILWLLMIICDYWWLFYDFWWLLLIIDNCWWLLTIILWLLIIICNYKKIILF